jgi:hypothetical protein
MVAKVMSVDPKAISVEPICFFWVRYQLAGEKRQKTEA